ncbi:MAG: tRNA lysidine(34) synthetase TilS [Phycisphaerae bacterium]
MKASRFLKRVRAYIDQHRLLEPGEPVVVGVSGGPDSMALLHALVAINRMDDRGWQLHVGHLDHGLRGADAQADAQRVLAEAKRLALPATVERTDVRSEAARHGRSVEEQARHSRYGFLERLCLRTASRCVAVGHHADDNAETILYRIIRGTGTRGLAGIRPSRPLRIGSEVRLVRPLLALRRAEIEAFLRAGRIDYRTDPSNVAADYARNRVRCQLLPLIQRSFNQRVVEALLRLGEQARWIDSYLAETAQRTLEALIVSQDQEQLVLNVPGLLRKSRIIQAELIRQAILRFQLGEQALGFGHLLAVLRQCEQPASGKSVHLPGGLVASRHYDRLVLSRRTAPPARRISPTSLAIPGSTLVPDASLQIDAQIIRFDYAMLKQVKSGKSRYEEWLDYDRLELPLVVRSRQRGDRFWPLGAPGSKRVAEFLIDEKVAPVLRSRAAIICDRRGPVWVVPLRIDNRVRLRPETKRALKLIVRPAADQ